MSNPFDGPVLKIILELPKEKREELFALMELIVPPKHIVRLRTLLAIELAARN